MDSPRHTHDRTIPDELENIIDESQLSESLLKFFKRVCNAVV